MPCFKKVFVVILSLFFSLPFLYAEDKKPADCFLLYAQNGQCPEQTCKLGCEWKNGQESCQQVCKPKPCAEIRLDDCPLDRCQTLASCEGGKDTCFDKENQAPPQCGPLAYTGQDIDCCPGLIRRCGVEFFDRTCDMVGKNSIYAIPICLPCGDGICGQFENRCNCPEDCREKGAYIGFDFEQYKIEKSYKGLPASVEKK